MPIIADEFQVVPQAAMIFDDQSTAFQQFDLFIDGESWFSVLFAFFWHKKTHRVRIPRRGVAGIVKKYYKRLSEFVNFFLQPNVDGLIKSPFARRFGGRHLELSRSGTQLFQHLFNVRVVWMSRQHYHHPVRSPEVGNITEG